MYLVKPIFLLNTDTVRLLLCQKFAYIDHKYVFVHQSETFVCNLL